MLWLIDSCQKGHSPTCVTWAQVYIVQVIEVTWFSKLSADQLLVLIVGRPRSILKKPYNK